MENSNFNVDEATPQQKARNFNKYKDMSKFSNINIDFVYRWHFSPGSDLYLTWKNNAFNNSDQLDKFSSTLSDTFHNKTRNSLTLKVLYYLDYNSLKKGGDTT